jgi:hypothetical protein
MRRSIFAMIALLAAPAAAQKPSIQIDRVRHEVAFIAGPFDVPPMDMHMHGTHAAMQMGHDEKVHTLYQFTWPVDGYAKAFRVEVRDARGNLLPSSLLHHVTGVTIDRRQYIYESSERLFGIGKETGDVVLPGNLAVPLNKGQRIGYYVAWNNTTAKELRGVSVRVVMTWAPPQATSQLIPVLPIWIDVNNEVGGTNTFDLPPGKSAKSFEFTPPVGGRILGISGHLHDYGVMVRLEDAETNTVLVNLPATRDANGQIRSMAKKFYAVNALRLKAGHRYRVVAVYDSPLKETIAKGAMGAVVGVIAPDDLARWPSVNPDDPQFRRDMASLGLTVSGRSGTQ